MLILIDPSVPSIDTSPLGYATTDTNHSVVPYPWHLILMGSHGGRRDKGIWPSPLVKGASPPSPSFTNWIDCMVEQQS